MADVSLTLTVPSQHVSRIINAVRSRYMMPQIDDPEWIDPEDGSSAPKIDEFTDKVWIKKCIINHFIRDIVLAYERNKAAEDAKNAVVVEEDIIV